MSPPLLNPEVKDAINSSVVRRDERLTSIQKQIDTTLAAIGLAITSILREGGGGQYYTILQSLGDAGRLLADLHCTKTRARRELALINLDSQVKDAFTSAPVTNYLFGDNLDERVTAAKNLKKFSQGLKPSVKPNIRPTQSTIRKNPVQKHLNYRSLPRPAQGNRQGRRQNYQQSPAYNKQPGQYNRYHQRSQATQRPPRKNTR